MKEIFRPPNLIFGAMLVTIVFLVRPDYRNKPTSSGGSFTHYFPLIAREPPAFVSSLEIANNLAGEKRVVGEVTSLSEQPLFDLIVRVDAFDASATLIGTYTDTLVLTSTLPTQVNMFDIGTGITSTATFIAEIISWENTSDVFYQEVTIISYDVDHIGSGAWVTATIRNDTDETLFDLIGVFWHVYQESPIEPEYITDSLEPGESYVYTTFVDVLPFSVPNAVIQGELNP